ncbi:MAG: M23 family metallopeptidase, partial [Fidelibacterota bacterium]
VIEIDQHVSRIKKELKNIEEKDNALRTYANLPLIDKDIRRVGVGGTSYDRISQLDFLIAGSGRKISELKFDVDKMAREISLEKLSYKEIYDSFRYNIELIKRTPSIKPVVGGYLNDGFGMRRDPFTNEIRPHRGVDISARKGTPVFATADGVVVYAQYKGTFGKAIKIDHGYGFSTVYAHLSKIYVKQGQKVHRRDIIGEVGNTGRSTAPHLHYEVRANDNPVNPFDYFFAGYLD